MNSQGFLPQLICKGYGAALEETHCNRDYGIESANPTYPQPWNILKNIIADFTEKSFAGASTGWGIDNTYVTDTFNTDIKYINNPYRTNLEVIDLVCQLTTAIGAGTDSGAHWIVDHNKTVGGKPRFLVAKIGGHAAGGTSPEDYWPDWWNTDPDDDDDISRALSILEQGKDFTEYTILDKAEEFANNVVLITDFRRPTYDYWTENHAELWGNITLDPENGVTAVTSPKVVGTHSIRLLTQSGGGAPGGYTYLSSGDSPWNVTKWGSNRTIPHLNFYMQKDANIAEALTSVRLYTTSYIEDYFEIYFSSWSEGDNAWYSKSLPIGPYWESAEESKDFKWAKGDLSVPGGDADWTDIKGIAFMTFRNNGTAANLYIDDLHFSGQIARSAKNSWSILGNADPLVKAKNEYQKVLISRNAMDDSCVAGVGAGKDDGFAARIAYAELLRRQKRPKTVILQTACDMKNAMAGQKIHVHICRRPDGSFRSTNWDNGGDMRIIELQEDLTAGAGILYTVTATTDLLNSAPINIPDQYAMWQENMFLNSKEAKNIRAGSEVDLLIPILESEYNSDDD